MPNDTSAEINSSSLLPARQHPHRFHQAPAKKRTSEITTSIFLKNQKLMPPSNNKVGDLYTQKLMLLVYESEIIH